ncbi:MAG: hypothetical protein AAB296_10765 [Candidatus Desantisbacteria bacterium]
MRKTLWGIILLVFLAISTANGEAAPLTLEVYPSQTLYLSLNSTTTLTAMFNNQSVEANWTKSNMFGDIGTLSVAFGTCTVLLTSSSPAQGTITVQLPEVLPPPEGLPHGTQTKQIRVMVGLAELFKAVNDRSSQINTFKAAYRLVMSVPALNVHETQTVKLLSKLPDKLKLSLYSLDAEHLQTQIYSGKYMTLIDKQGKIYKKDITGFVEEMNTPNIVFQLDLHRFLNEHHLDFNPMFTNPPSYGVNALPERKNDYYDRLLFVIEYDKGLVSRREVYKDDNLISSVWIEDYENVDNLWFGKQSVTKTIASGYEVVHEIRYDSIEVNGEIGDEEFR